jgi:hypothetical protein
MTNPDVLNALAERVEGLSGPCRETDRAIERANPLCLDYGFDDSDRPTPAYTSDMNAAMGLVPNGWCYLDLRRFDDGSFACSMELIGIRVSEVEATSATPCLAMLGAALRAHAAMVEEG